MLAAGWVVDENGALRRKSGGISWKLKVGGCKSGVISYKLQVASWKLEVSYDE